MRTYQTPTEVRQAMQQASMRAAELTKQFNAAANSDDVCYPHDVDQGTPVEHPDLSKVLAQMQL
ncbi:hypothetical protein [Ralstonia pseudosolanacearum]|uniref:hypothetical protein n=1 Tax=Ralstonia pseudosolanacearum TaxID=1310165 RepID=UPI001FF81EE8|nr:hypothetical protein [Ralstonia pseudosolanacearum]